jgi:homoserine dehydrogenase
MEKKTIIRIGFIGLGTVGQGVWKHMQADRAALEQRLGVGIELYRAAVNNLDKKRSIQIPQSKITDNAMAVATDPKVDILCELMGGTTLAKQVTLAALEQKKPIVTANKALLCQHGPELFKATRSHKNHYFFEASVAGGIPIIKSIREGLVANRFPLICGILNGTCNYILTRMERERLPFETIVQDARTLGYVEADESLDLDGWDTAHKAIILTYLAHGKWLPLDKIPVEGIRNITLEDILWAKEIGNYKIKLLAMITRDFTTNKLSLRVHPALIPQHKILANINEEYNAISVTGDIVGTTIHIGRGAGQDATASSVISDIVDAILTLQGKPPLIETYEDDPPLQLAIPAEITGKYYLRLTVCDKPGVLAHIAAIMEKNTISIASVRQKPREKNTASLVLTTHASNEKSMQQTLHALETLKEVKAPPLLLRIAQFQD